MSQAPARATAAGPVRDRHGQWLAAGLAALDAGHHDDALAEAERLLAAAPSHNSGLVLLGFISLLRNQPALSLEALTAAHEAAPDDPLVSEALAILHAVAGELADATFFAKLAQANGLDESVMRGFPKAWPSFATAFMGIRERPFYHKGLSALDIHQPELAAAFFEGQLAFQPDDGQSLRALADCRLALGQPRRAAELLDRFGAVKADARDLSRLSTCLAMSGEPARAAALADAAGRRAPSDTEVATAAVVAAIYDPAATASRLRDLTCDRYRQLPPALPLVPPAPLSDGPLRLGLLLGRPWDADLTATVAAFAQGCRGLADVTLVIFGDGVIDQPCYAPLHGRVDRWIDIGQFDPATLAVVIRGESVDVLIDAGGLGAALSGATLAHHPAPLCVAWTGQPVAVPMPGVDLLLSAPGLDSAAGDAPLAECAGGLFATPPGPHPAPRPADGQILYGADLAFGQLHDELLDAWAAILSAVPEARLVLRDREFSHPEAVSTLIARTGARGFADRIEVMDGSRAAVAEAVDVMLCPFVATDGFDALAALAAGRPAVAWAGAGRHRRFAAAVLAAADAAQWIADSPADYVAKAVALAEDPAAASRQAARAAARLSPQRLAEGIVAAIRKGFSS